MARREGASGASLIIRHKNLRVLLLRALCNVRCPAPPDQQSCIWPQLHRRCCLLPLPHPTLHLSLHRSDPSPPPPTPPSHTISHPAPPFPLPSLLPRCSSGRHLQASDLILSCLPAAAVPNDSFLSSTCRTRLHPSPCRVSLTTALQAASALHHPAHHVRAPSATPPSNPRCPSLLHRRPTLRALQSVLQLQHQQAGLPAAPTPPPPPPVPLYRHPPLAAAAPSALR
jgi:hypothetical protein